MTAGPKPASQATIMTVRRNGGAGSGSMRNRSGMSTPMVATVAARATT
jgi:hypothetical protein